VTNLINMSEREYFAQFAKRTGMFIGRTSLTGVTAFTVPVGKAAPSHHFTVLRAAGLVEQRDQGPKRLHRLRREEFLLPRAARPGPARGAPVAGVMAGRPCSPSAPH